MAAQISVRTEDLPAADRFDFWMEVVTSQVIPVLVRSTHEDDFRATITGVDLSSVQAPGLQATLMSFPTLEARRTSRLIKKSDPGDFHLAVNLRGSATIVQDRQTVVLAPNELTLYDTSRPFVDQVNGDEHGLGAGLLITLPRAFIRSVRWARRLEGRAPIRMSASSGIAGLATRQLIETVRHADQYTAADRARIGTVTTELLQAMFADAIEDHDAARDAYHEVLLLQARDHITRNITDPTLSVDSVAAAHGISTRTLQRVFADADESVSDLIRVERLERCRRDIQRHPDVVLHTVATRWGFSSHSAFSRAFKATYGVSPTGYRDQVLQQQPGRG